MLGKTAIVLSMLSLTACAVGEVGADGQAASGPMGQKPLMTDTVQASFSQALSACQKGTGLDSLGTRGFSPVRNGYQAKIDNPNLLGRSVVSAKQTREGCIVGVTPIFPVEESTVRNLVARISAPANTSMRSGTRGGVGFAEVIFP
ncbi:hypothetical protein [Mangrovicoccus algicola]|uniref:Lipoprotein n=1 Tax=Mangrovicoccus algicola TaxID=2771008 RepID=A0A8J6YV29_9RHOB|nr:hypothetical protein [Mangrovicoccus algicola]MBE3636694.1 hypothetical protein [Mangrovicoccus algicola]